ncbi:MAG: acyl-protein synthetase [Clostridiales bacterium]|nr:acyl-protein synthetase [Clostridiales bacterium]
MTYDDLLAFGPYDLGQEEKDRIYRELLGELTDHHRTHCAVYDRVCGLLGDESGTERAVEAVPMVPVSLFKTLPLCSVPEDEIFKTMTSSGTTGQQPSRIFLDRQTAAWQQRTLERIVSSFIGPKRIPMLIIDSPNVLRDRRLFSARGAGILGFSIFGTRRRYALNDQMELDFASIEQFIRDADGGPALIFGFTYMIWKYFCQALREAGRTLPLDRGILIHGGGWKKLQNEAVSTEEFRRGLHETCGLTVVRDYYGMAEQTGCIYMECECGHLHVSSYSEILIRRMEDFSCCENGTEGVIQVLTPMARSYPGHSILTEDKGVILGIDDCPCGRKGKYFKITGRIPKAEVRGCSDTYEG